MIDVKRQTGCARTATYSVCRTANCLNAHLCTDLDRFLHFHIGKVGVVSTNSGSKHADRIASCQHRYNLPVLAHSLVLQSRCWFSSTEIHLHPTVRRAQAILSTNTSECARLIEHPISRAEFQVFETNTITMPSALQRKLLMPTLCPDL